ncbi:MAG: hypothetical protein Q8P68_04785 [Candidatus Peregrinibacteria bacterium]|nr:hypothetical protein [Candidatus Peregrinibacteria bacterium]
MLGLISQELVEKFGLTDREDPTLTIGVTVKSGLPEVSVWPPENGVLDASIQKAIKAEELGCVSGSAVYRITVSGNAEIDTEDTRFARRVFDSFRRDLFQPMEDLAELAEQLPKRSQFEEMVCSAYRATCYQLAYRNNILGANPEKAPIHVECPKHHHIHDMLRERNGTGNVLPILLDGVKKLDKKVKRSSKDPMSAVLKIFEEACEDRLHSDPTENIRICSRLTCKNLFFPASIILCHKAATTVLAKYCNAIANEVASELENKARILREMTQIVH